MVDWDADSPSARENLTRVLREARDAAERRDRLSIATARKWHANMMRSLDVPAAAYVGRFRGEPGLRALRVLVGPHHGVEPEEVREQLAHFERRLQQALTLLDTQYASGTELDIDGLSAVLDLSAWAHAEWVRIHPFANGNGRTARIWANAVLMRYGLPPFVRLRPRPNQGYGAASDRAMVGDWKPTARMFRRMLRDELAREA